MGKKRQRQIEQAAFTAMEAAVGVFMELAQAGPSRLQTAQQLQREEDEWSEYVELLISHLEDLSYVLA